ncbi:hypothetical protein DRQ09_06535 [candidate division KSB1 bacterium]|nr:MAG: hypothetical protein DRQ09_06535 [candidate division KSB1 bacterium]
MPPIWLYKCSKCGFHISIGWGGTMYVEDDNGNRIECMHPGEMSTVVKVLGKNLSMELIRKRTGFNSDCICLDCLNFFKADFGDEIANPWRFYYGATNKKDKRECPGCKSQNVKTVFEMIGQICPKCKDGVIKIFETGLIT